MGISKEFRIEIDAYQKSCAYIPFSKIVTRIGSTVVSESRKRFSPRTMTF